MLCQVCQIPMLFTEPDDPTKICYRESDYQGEKYHTCSDGCKHIFDDEPEKYIQAWLPVHQIYQGNCFPEGTDPTVEGFDPLAASMLEWCHIEERQGQPAIMRALATRPTLQPGVARLSRTPDRSQSGRRARLRPPCKNLGDKHGCQSPLRLSISPLPIHRTSSMATNCSTSAGMTT